MYDILKHQNLVLTKGAVDAVMARLGDNMEMRSILVRPLVTEDTSDAHDEKTYTCLRLV